MMRWIALALLLALPLPVVGGESPPAPESKMPVQTGLETSPLIVLGRDSQHKFTVEVARTRQEQSIGLMGRTGMEPDTGMLFPLNPPQEMAMWMKNTLIPLDMVFISPQMKIFRLRENAKPNDLTTIPSGGKAAAVLELPAGTVKKLNLRIGDRVISPALQESKPLAP